MNIVDILIVIFVLLGAFVGAKQGFTKALVSFLGIIIVVVIAYFLKNPVSELLMSVGPFFNFGGIIKGVTVLNIAVYEIIAFVLVFAILMAILNALLFATGIFEKLLKFTIVLGVPSSIFGAIIGAIKNYVIAFFVLYILSMPNFVDVTFVKDSEFREPILRNTPLLSNIAGSTLEVLDEFKGIADKYTDSEDTNAYNLETLDVFLKYKVVTVDTIEKLVESGKININGIETVLNKYKEDNYGNN